ncbi:alpha-ketoglutarate-dependent dioxygenase alkB homolog 3-like [Mercenaria mercenaria]|uniref:alpha-ketoglutarate-dependent dioxygenase alkB homolog 3-like n=1 Tax=Mercenaria mercenaria TaxID=6596 RepID=UPI00234ED6BF|nr:alpha-ketoglutarate-dependent dioxygenase alkB homolog 3-like [Mercenaria mercenaria]
MNDKRRRARVQGGWAPSLNVRSDRDKAKPQNVPSWFGKNIDQVQPSSSTKKFVYEQPSEELRQKPADKVISKPGVYDISSEPSGLSRLRFFPDFLDPKNADQMYEELFHGLPWRQRSDVKNGEKYLQPRLTAWYGDHPYRYSGVTHDACTEWHPTLQRIKHLLEESTGLEFNSMLANLYRDGHDSLAWHSDDEKSLGPDPTIASISFGDTRTFQMRKKPPATENGDYTYMQHVEVPLTHGSLLIMEGSTQDDWQHRIPREYHDRSGRINLTFRVIFPDM